MGVRQSESSKTNARNHPKSPTREFLQHQAYPQPSEPRNLTLETARPLQRLPQPAAIQNAHLSHSPRQHLPNPTQLHSTHPPRKRPRRKHKFIIHDSFDFPAEKHARRMDRDGLVA
jgi:hypothetical protein